MRRHHHHFVGALSCLLFVLGIVSITFGVQTVRAAGGYTLSVSFLGTGGVVTSSPAGINCGGDCAEEYPDGTIVTLTASPTDPAKQFAYWNKIGGFMCSEAGGSSTHSGTTCSLNVGNTAYGNFMQAAWVYKNTSVTIAKTGTGSGTVTGASTYAYNQTGTFTATPDSSSTFVGWETSGTICALYSKGSSSLNPNATCTKKFYGDKQSETAIARFDKKATTSTSATTKPTNSAPTTTAATKPGAPELAATKIGDQTVDAAKPITVAADKPLVLSGKTVSNGIVKLYIFSEPKTATVTADKDGNWTYSVTGLPAGDHHVEAEVIDPSNNQTSERKNVLAFTVAAAAAPVTTQAQAVQKTGTAWYVWVVGGLLLLAAAAGGFYYWWRTHKLHRSFFSHGSSTSSGVITPNSTADSAAKEDTHES